MMLRGAPHRAADGAEAAALLPQNGTTSKEPAPPLPKKGQLQQEYDRLTRSLVNFWYNDPALYPLYGPLRFVFYGTMLVILLTRPGGSGSQAFLMSSCNRALGRFEHYEDFGFDMKFEAGFFGHSLAYFGLDPRTIFNCSLLQSCVRWGLVLSAIGLGGILPRIVAATAWWTMFGIKMASFGPSVGHEQYLPGVAMVTFCFAENNFIDGWSVDSLLYKVRAKFRGGPASRNVATTASAGWDGISPSPGCAARKFVLFQACCVMFFAGVHKFATYGYIWLDGRTILYSLHEGNNARIDFMRAFVAANSWAFVAPMATVSVIGELLSMAAVLSPPWRHVVVGSWVMFHVGIMVLMHPNFAMNMTTYIVVIDWRGLLGKTRLATYLPFLSEGHARGGERGEAPVMKSATRPSGKGALIYTLFGMIMFVTAMLRIDFWPFSSYALYNWHPSDPGYFGAMFTPSEAIASAGRCLSQPPIGPTCANKCGSNHHDSFVHTRKQYIKKVLVTGVDPDGDEHVKDGECRPDHLRVYVDFEPHSCHAGPKDGSELSAEDIQEIMRSAIAKPKSAKRRPQKLPKVFTDYVRKGLKWRIEDSMTASLEENPACFQEAGSSNEHTWMADPSQDSMASDMARRLRRGLTEHNYLPNHSEKALGVGLFFEFMDGGTGKRNKDGLVEGGTPQWCKLGESVMGEPDLLSADGKKFRDHIKHHDRYWTEVIRGIVLVVVMASVLGIHVQQKRPRESSPQLPVNQKHH